MGMEKLTASMLSEARKEAEGIVSSAERHVKHMLEEEKAKSAGLVREAKNAAESSLQDQRNERLAWARLEAKRTLAEAREDAIKNTLEDFFSLLKGVRAFPEYRKFLGIAVKQAVEDLGVQKPTLHLCKGDAKLIDKPDSCRIVEDLEGFGGAIVESSDGSVRVNMTLESLFESGRDGLRKHISDILFR